MIKIETDRRPLQIACRENTTDYAVVEHIWKHQTYNLGRLRRKNDIEAFYTAILRSGRIPLIIDAGANIGASALWFDYVFPESRILAVEPESSNFDLLQQNCQDKINITCLKSALSSDNQDCRVIDAGRNEWGFVTTPLSECAGIDVSLAGQTVPSITVHQCLNDNRSSCVPFLIKIDIEGGEKKLFAKNTSWIDDFPLLVIELHDWMLPGEAISQNFLAAISSSGRDFVHIGENIFSIRN